MKKLLLGCIAVIVLLVTNTAWSQEKSDSAALDLGSIIVSATKTDVNQAQVGSSTTVITATDIKKIQATTVQDVLRDVPGIIVSQAGAVGGQTSVYLRGADAGQTLVLIDGVEVNDPMSTDRSFDFANLTTNNIERIEIVRGPQSTLYGSNAMAGVINIITKEGNGPPKVEGYFEGGSHNTFTENLGSSGSIYLEGGIVAKSNFSEADPVNGAAVLEKLIKQGVLEEVNANEVRLKDNTGGPIIRPQEISGNNFDAIWEILQPSHRLNYSLSTTHTDSSGIPIAAGGSENNPYHNSAVSSRVGYQIFNDAKLSLVVNYADAKKSIDNYTYQPIDTSNYNSWSKDLSTKFAFDQAISSWWTHTLSYSYHDISRKDINGGDPDNSVTAFNDWYKGDNDKVEWQNNFTPVQWDIVTVGVDYQDETGSSYSDEYWPSEQNRKNVYDIGYYLQNQFKLWGKLFVTPGIRIDDNELFGTDTTYKISTAYFISQTGTRLKGNWGTGFKAPTLFELYSSYGDPNLKPDRSKSYDFGVEQNFFKDKLSLDLTYFHNDFRDMVNYDYLTNKYDNVGMAVTRGFEFGTKIRTFKNITIGGNFTYTDAEDKDTGLELLRRPKEKVDFSVDWKFIENADLDLDVIHSGSRHDIAYDANWNTIYVIEKAYTTVRLAVSCDITKNFQIFSRVENLFDERYQEVYGYSTLGRSFYGGVKVKF